MHKIVNERARKEKEVKKCNSGETRGQRDVDSDMLQFLTVRNKMIMYMYVLVPKGKDQAK